jgi:hypothetical protein
MEKDEAKIDQPNDAKLCKLKIFKFKSKTIALA